MAAAARVSVYLVVKPEFPAKNVQEFLAYAKANPGKLSYGSPGNGSSPHLAGEMMNSQAGTSTRHIPYRGAAPALQDLLGGQIDFLMDPGIALPQVQAGKLRLLAVGGLQRSPLYPDVPTLDESGLKGFDADTLFGFYAPAGTPKPVIDRLNAEINRILATKPVADRIVALGGADGADDAGAVRRQGARRLPALRRDHPGAQDRRRLIRRRRRSGALQATRTRHSPGPGHVRILRNAHPTHQTAARPRRRRGCSRSTGTSSARPAACTPRCSPRALRWR